jgi:hypothetical protein
MLTHKGASSVPQTKLDWLLQAVQPETLSFTDATISHSPIKSQAELSRPHFAERGISSQEKFESAAYVKELDKIKMWPTMRSSRTFSWKEVPTPSDTSTHHHDHHRRKTVSSVLSDDAPPSITLDLEEEGRALYPPDTWPQ